MCLIVLSYDHHERYRLVFAGNRDEFHARPSQAAAWWPDAPELLAGRDLEAGGTWLGITRAGRFAAVTNYREHPSEATAQPASRGTLVTDFLRSDVSAREHVLGLRAAADRYRGFCLIVGDGSGLWFVSNRDSDPRPLDRGTFGLSNELLDVPWPKVVRAKTALDRILEREVSTTALLDLLADRTPLDIGAVEPESALARAASSIFVKTPHYGTRCSTAITITHTGDVELAERSFDARGATVGEQRFEFRIAGSIGR